jgi:hypothetical protein
MAEEEKFSWIKFFGGGAGKFILSFIGMILWSVLVYADKLSDLREMGLAGVVFGTLAGVMAAKDIADVIRSRRTSEGG